MFFIMSVGCESLVDFKRLIAEPVVLVVLFTATIAVFSAAFVVAVAVVVTAPTTVCCRRIGSLKFILVHAVHAFHAFHAVHAVHVMISVFTFVSLAVTITIHRMFIAVVTIMVAVTMAVLSAEHINHLNGHRHLAFMIMVTVVHICFVLHHGIIPGHSAVIPIIVTIGISDTSDQKKRCLE